MATIESELLNKNDFLMLTVYSLISAQVMNPCTNRYLLVTFLTRGTKKRMETA